MPPDRQGGSARDKNEPSWPFAVEPDGSRKDDDDGCVGCGKSVADDRARVVVVEKDVTAVRAVADVIVDGPDDNPAAAEGSGGEGAAL